MLGMARKKKSIKSQVVKDMKELGVYRVEYRNDINIYVDMIHQWEVLSERFAESGYLVEEEYTNKAGATNMRKTPTLATLEKLRVDIAQYSDRLCLNPKSLERVTVEKNTTSKLASVLNSFE